MEPFFQNKLVSLVPFVSILTRDVTFHQHEGSMINNLYLHEQPELMRFFKCSIHAGILGAAGIITLLNLKVETTYFFYVLSTLLLVAYAFLLFRRALFYNSLTVKD